MKALTLEPSSLGLKRLHIGPKAPNREEAGPEVPPDDLLRAGLAASGGHRAWLCSQGRARGSCPVWRLEVAGWGKGGH